MLQVPNIMRHPQIWLPAILSSAILGPVGTMAANMQNNATGSGMGSAGLVGQLTTYETMIAYDPASTVLIKILLLQFHSPGSPHPSLLRIHEKERTIREAICLWASDQTENSRPVPVFFLLYTTSGTASPDRNSPLRGCSS